MEKGIGISEQPARVTAPQTPDLGEGEGDVAGTFRTGAALGRLQTDNVMLDDTRRELLETLELRTRRVNQLLGERDVLERQLMRAERSMQQLSRELGAAGLRKPGAVAACSRPLWQTFGDQLRAGLARLWLKQGKPKPTSSSVAAPAGNRSGPLVPFAQKGKARRVMAVVALGLEPDQRGSVLDVVARYGTEGDVVPLVLTDDDDFAPLRSRSMLFEYFPPPADRERLAPALEWELYLLRRLALIRRKWRPVRVIAFGRTAAGLVRLWSESPFEDPSLGRLPAAERSAGPSRGPDRPAHGA
jgi:hypothetical protein